MKTLLAGVGMAAAAGLLLGGAMKPNLGGDERPEGPQIFAGWSGVRSTGPFDPGPGFASYQGQVPDYVIGTDWKADAYAFTDEVAYEPPPPADEAPDAPYAEDLPQVEPYQEPPRTEPLYPSLAGGARYASDRAPAALPPPPPRMATANIDSEAPPEATGDTRPAI